MAGPEQMPGYDHLTASILQKKVGAVIPFFLPAGASSAGGGSATETTTAEQRIQRSTKHKQMHKVIIQAQ